MCISCWKKEDISTILAGLFAFLPGVFWEEVSGGDLEVGSDVIWSGPKFGMSGHTAAFAFYALHTQL